jgi:tRNA pseudouridine55 synthase
LIDKPAGPTSHDAVSQVRRALGLRSVGHTGTLDPFASGLLIVLAGRATRLARFLDGLSKTYTGVARLGVRTDTDDRTGTPLGKPVSLAGIDERRVAAEVHAMTGSYLQRPPVYSAKKVGGVRSYRRARQGEPVSVPEVPVTVYAAELLGLDGDRATFRVRVSTGTYIRALARDLGERLGVGAHLDELRREAIGSLRVGDAVPLADVGPGTPLVPLTRVLEHLPAVGLDEVQRADVRHGRRLRSRDTEGPRAREPVVLTADGVDVAVARVEEGYLQPVVVLEGQ